MPISHNSYAIVQQLAIAVISVFGVIVDVLGYAVTRAVRVELAPAVPTSSIHSIRHALICCNHHYIVIIPATLSAPNVSRSKAKHPQCLLSASLLMSLRNFRHCTGEIGALFAVIDLYCGKA